MFNKNVLIFATDNKNKVDEITKMTPSGFSFEFITKKDAGILEEIEEGTESIIANAKLKADYISKNYGCNCFAEDTGLFIEALDGEPGVKSARYASENHDDNQNIQLVLNRLQGKVNRNAYFCTVIALNINNQQFIFEGRIGGKILYTKQGSMGFGYDPIFMPDGTNKSFAELTKEEKNSISHRGIAFKKLIEFLSSYILDLNSA